MSRGRKPNSIKALEENREKTQISGEEAVEKGRSGGIKSGQVRRAKKNMRETIQMIMDMPAVGTTKASLKQLGLDDNEQTNMAAFAVKLYLMSMNGNLKAGELLAQMGGLGQEEARKDNDDRRKTEESKARVQAIMSNLGKDMQISSGDSDGDVIIYMPKLDEEPEEKDDED